MSSVSTTINTEKGRSTCAFRISLHRMMLSSSARFLSSFLFGVQADALHLSQGGPSNEDGEGPQRQQIRQCLEEGETRADPEAECEEL